jgi:hypothetical protein
MADEQPGDRTVIQERRNNPEWAKFGVAEKDDANQRRAQEFNYDAEKANQGQCLPAHHPDGPDATAGGHGASTGQKRLRIILYALLRLTP